MGAKIYIGDSVYAELYEEMGAPEIILTTENGLGPSNKIILELEIWETLKTVVEDWLDEKEGLA